MSQALHGPFLILQMVLQVLTTSFLILKATHIGLHVRFRFTTTCHLFQQLVLGIHTTILLVLQVTFQTIDRTLQRNRITFLLRYNSCYGDSTLTRALRIAEYLPFLLTK